MSWNEMRGLMIDDATVAKAKEVKAYAIAHRETLPHIKDRISTNAPGPANDENHILFIPVGYRVVYSIEQQKVGWVQHISFAVDNPTRWPDPKAVSHILRECFGIQWIAGKGMEVDEDHQTVRVDNHPVNIVSLWFKFDFALVTSPEPDAGKIL